MLTKKDEFVLNCLDALKKVSFESLRALYNSELWFWQRESAYDFGDRLDSLEGEGLVKPSIEDGHLCYRLTKKGVECLT